MLAAGQLDVVLSTLDYPADETGLTSIPLTSVEQAVVLPPDSPLLANHSLSIGDIESLSWVLYGGDKHNEQWLNHYFFEHSLGTPKVTLRTSSFSTGIEMVRHGATVMMAPLQLRTYVHSFGLEVRPVDPPISQRKAGIYTRPSLVGLGVINRLIELLRQECSS